jgi:hypothetical protein
VSRLSISIAAVLLALSASALVAQNATDPKIDLALTYTAERTTKANTGQNVWLQGGSLQLGTDIYRGFGLAADFTGLHTSSIGSSGVPFSEFTATFGPRYRWHGGHKVSVYGQALAGEGDAFNTVLPGQTAAQTGTNSLAVKIGGGVDYSLSKRFAVRAVDASWVRTQFANTTDNLQNDFRIGAGLVVKFGH